MDTVALTVEKASDDILVFLPGVGEINRVRQASNAMLRCVRLRLWSFTVACHLSSRTDPVSPKSAARGALDERGGTSLTLDGISHVIDSGQVRVLRFDPQVGLDRLQLEPICQSSADQRAGRAGRLASGTCIRLWDAKRQRSRPPHLDPEIRRVDLCGALLAAVRLGGTAGW